MKKLFYLLVCLVLVGAMALTVAAAGGSVSVTPSASRLDREETFTLVAELDNSDPIKIAQVMLDYDTNVFELVDGKCVVEDYAIGQVLPDKKVGTLMMNQSISSTPV